MIPTESEAETKVLLWNNGKPFMRGLEFTIMDHDGKTWKRSNDGRYYVMIRNSGGGQGMWYMDETSVIHADDPD